MDKLNFIKSNPLFDKLNQNPLVKQIVILVLIFALTIVVMYFVNVGVIS